MQECSSCQRCLSDEHALCPDDGTELTASIPGSADVDRKYRLIRRIGDGGMGAVYKARHLGLDRPVAVKLLRNGSSASPEASARFRREASILGRLLHRNIVSVSDYGVEPERELPYLVMELLDGQSLRDHIRQAGPMPLEQALPVLRDIAVALDHAHQLGILHRDLKPSNVFLPPPSEGGAVRLLDFGLAKLAQDPFETPALEPLESSRSSSPRSRNWTESRLAGTPGYMAPELQSGRDATAASDLYAFGVLVRTILTGKDPSRTGSAPGTTGADLAALPPGLQTVLEAALSAQPENRPATAGALVAQLEGEAHEHDLRRWRRRELPRRAGIALALAATATVATWSLAASLFWLENPLVDLRFYLATARPPDGRLLMVLVDDATLNLDPTPLAEKADEVGTLLAATMEAGARGVAIDFLLPAQWSHSRPFTDFVLKHANAVTLTAFSAEDGSVLGLEVAEGPIAVALGPEPARRLFGFVNLLEDPDGVVRRAHSLLPAAHAPGEHSFASRAAALVDASRAVSREPFWIDYSVDWTSLPRISWRDLADRLRDEPDLFRDRLVVAGGDFSASGDSNHRVPHRKGMPVSIPGAVLQTLTIDTMLSNFPVRFGATPGQWLVYTMIAAASVMSLLCMPSRRARLVVPAVGALLWVGLAWSSFAGTRALTPVASPLIVYAILCGVALMLRASLPPIPALSHAREKP